MSKVIFTDLDHTLIYSKRHFKTVQDLLCIEYLDGKPQSFIEKSNLRKISLLSSQYEWVPTTTRSLEQYRRLRDLEQVLQSNIAIVANGAIILKEGKRIEAWDKLISLYLQSIESLKDIENQVRDVVQAFSSVKSIVSRDDVYLTVILTSTVDLEQLTSLLMEALKKTSWTLWDQGKKLYIIPREITKERAVRYVKKYLKPSYTIGLGDSIMDYNFLCETDWAYISSGSTLMKSGFVHSSTIQILNDSESLYVSRVMDFLIENMS